MYLSFVNRNTKSKAKKKNINDTFFFSLSKLVQKTYFTVMKPIGDRLKVFCF